MGDAMKSGHGVKEKERDGVEDVGRVGRTCGHERRHRAGFGDPFLKDLSVFRFFVIQQCVYINGLINLAHMRIDADLAEERFHAEGARFVWNDGTTIFPNSGSRSNFFNMPTKAMVVETSRPSLPERNSWNESSCLASSSGLALTNRFGT